MLLTRKCSIVLFFAIAGGSVLGAGPNDPKKPQAGPATATTVSEKKGPAKLIKPLPNSNLTAEDEEKLLKRIRSRVEFSVPTADNKQGQAMARGLKDDHEKGSSKGLILFLQMIDDLNVSRAHAYCGDKLKELGKGAGGPKDPSPKIGDMETFNVNKPQPNTQGQYPDALQKELACYVSRLHFVSEVLKMGAALSATKPNDSIHEDVKTIEEYIKRSRKLDEQVDKIWKDLDKENAPFTVLFKIFEDPRAKQEPRPAPPAQPSQQQARKPQMPCLLSKIGESLSSMANNALKLGQQMFDQFDAPQQLSASNTSMTTDYALEGAYSVILFDIEVEGRTLSTVAENCRNGSGNGSIERRGGN